MKILSAEQTRALDAYTIANEPIASIDLMERASLTFVKWLVQPFPDSDRKVLILVGPGNNGGDGLAVARLLHRRFYDVAVWRCHIGAAVSPDFQINWDRLPTEGGAIAVHHLHAGDPLPDWPQGALLIDALFGSGLSRPVTGYWADLIRHCNEQSLTRVAIDVPSGLFTDGPSEGAVLEAHYTFSFETPKLAFFLPDNQQRVGEWRFGSIGLDAGFLSEISTLFHFVEAASARNMLKTRRRFDHKGVFGHALICAGSYGKAGAAVLATRACLRSGAGLVTVHTPRCAYPILQTAAPEAMTLADAHELHISEMPDLSPFSAIGAGCGWGQEELTANALHQLLECAVQPLVLDADALNLLALHPEWMKLLPENTILTPHPKEFERMFGPSNNGFERLEILRKKAAELHVVIVLKGAFSCIASPDGHCYFNATGNPGMATGGSGDVLTGIITGLRAQGYAALDAAVLGVYLHGLAGDLAAKQKGQEALIAGDLIEMMGAAFLHIQNTTT
ncbi:MAG TPA: NAD(P)H-hydrate dehydratase [Saprospiraceae bacterium]|mgnify:CR=1 FL=1|nr:NAD(P)H-hydrate dehydratase [Saprospiraceae bacterium]